MKTPHCTQILPGDCLLYAGHSPLAWIIKTKTWSPVSHAEVYVGKGKTATARPARGVNYYTVTHKDLYAVLRPETTVDIEAATRWFDAVAVGQPYGYWQAFRFFRLRAFAEDTTRMMCSPCVTRWYRQGGFHPFNGQYDASLVSPGMFLASPRMTTVWRA